jgi:hypothetical protein
MLVCVRLVYLIVTNDWAGSARKAQAHMQSSGDRVRGLQAAL